MPIGQKEINKNERTNDINEWHLNIERSKIEQRYTFYIGKTKIKCRKSEEYRLGRE